MKLLYSCIALCLLAVIYMSAVKPAYAVCASPTGTDGAITYNSANKIFQYCKGTTWSPMNIQPGTGSGGCTTPTLAEGQIAYNADHRVLQGCAGNVHRAFGPVGGGNVWKKVSSTDLFSCGIRTDNTLYCWGWNPHGQLGNNVTGVNQGTPVAVSGGGTWRDISVGGMHACGIKSDNRLYCWGFNSNGQLGTGNTTDRSVPTVVGTAQWRTVVTGAAHTCGIQLNSNALFCWGNNGAYRLGDNSTTQRNSPTAVNGGGSWLSVAPGEAHTCGIKSDNTAWCWGYNNAGRTGLNTTAGSAQVPTAVNGGGTWKKLSAGGDHSCGIKSDNSLWCWGNNPYGQLGDNTISGKTIPTAVNGGGTWLDVATAAYDHTCAIRTNNTMSCWGQNNFGQLGDGTLTQRLVPTAIATSGTWSAVSMGDNSTCGTTNTGGVRCWGFNGFGNMGNNTMITVPSPDRVLFGGTWTQLDSGLGNVCALRSDNTIWCWGENNWSLFGNNGSGVAYDPVTVSGGSAWKYVDMGYEQTCGIKTDDTLHCWGYNGPEGRLGDGTNTARPIPQPSAAGGAWKMISEGITHGCGIRTNDQLWCWGAGANGQIGDNNTSNRLTAVQVSGGGAWKFVSAGMNHTCGIKSDDTLWCWGSNGGGQLGDNTTGQKQIPTAINGGGSWSSVSASWGVTCGIKIDGSLWCWGENFDGKLGDNSTTQRLIPTAVSGGGSWKWVSTGPGHTCGIKADDTGWCWGINDTGKLGDGTTTNRLVPTALLGGGKWSKISAAEKSTCAISLGGGQLYCWGNNETSGAIGRTERSPIYEITAASPSCVNPLGKPGAIKYNSSQNVLQYCDSAGWVGINDGTTPALPVAPEGIPTTGLIAYWAFNETTGTTAADSSGNSNNGTLMNMNNADWVTGIFGNAIDFDGVDDYVNVPHNNILNITSSFTISSWVRPATLPGAMAYLTMLVKQTGIDPNYWFEVRGTEFLSGFVNGGYREHFSGAGVVVGTWYHVAVVFDDAANRFKVYINGMLVTNDSETLAPATTGTGPIIIGAQGAGNQNMAVSMDELRIYNRALTDSEVQALARP